MSTTHLIDRTDFACEQLKRYGASVQTEAIADALDALTNVNDDVAHARHPTCVKESTDKVRAALDRIDAEARRDFT